MADRNYTVYRHTTPSGKCYYGITSCSVRQRKSAGYWHNEHFHRAIKKYGWENIKTEIVAENLSRDAAELYETLLIESYETTNPQNGYNIEPGGLAAGFSEYSRRKISEAAKRRHVPASPSKRKNLQMSSHTRKAVRCKTTGDIYLSIRSAAIANGISPRHLRRALQGKIKTAAGLEWELV